MGWGFPAVTPADYAAAEATVKAAKAALMDLDANEAMRYSAEWWKAEKALREARKTLRLLGR